jgi:hypothetical protein
LEAVSSPYRQTLIHAIQSNVHIAQKATPIGANLTYKLNEKQHTHSYIIEIIAVGRRQFDKKKKKWTQIFCFCPVKSDQATIQRSYYLSRFFACLFAHYSHRFFEPSPVEHENVRILVRIE